MQYSKSIMLKENFDVVVCGGGFSGFSAAYSAAREGAKVIIIERNSSLGGVGTNSLVNHILGVRLHEDGTIFTCVDGLFGILEKSLVARGGGIDINTEVYDSFPIYPSPDTYEGTCDVIVDFSHPSVFKSLLNFAVEKKFPIVVCTTGLSESDRELMKNASETIPVFFSANMSLGVNLLIDLARKATTVLEDNFDIEIIERHHNQKIDAPSGTALAIADAIADTAIGSKNYVYDRHSVRKKRSKDEIGIHAVRGGTIVGQHDVIFAGVDEVIEIKHTATSKEVFAVGALKAAKFMKDKPAGYYSMNDLFKD